MRHVHPLAFLASCIFAVSFLVGSAALVGCASSPFNVDAVRPASIADLNALRTDHDAAFKAVEADLTAAQVATANLAPAIQGLDAKAEAAKADAEESTSPLATILAAVGSLLAAYVGIPVMVNAKRNKSRAVALAKVKTDTTLASVGKPPTV